MIFEVWPRDLDSSHGRTVTDAADSEDAAQKFGQIEDYETASINKKRKQVSSNDRR